tara:strand:+ start:434 stop:1645 length:1212 start_codon:yes stop_codon:yes gene_type:complete
MGYQQPKTPRFFIDMFSYIHSIGYSGPFGKTSFDGYVNDFTKTSYLYNDNNNINIQNWRQGETDAKHFALNFSWEQDDGYPDQLPMFLCDCFFILNHNLEGHAPLITLSSALGSMHFITNGIPMGNIVELFNFGENGTSGDPESYGMDYNGFSYIIFNEIQLGNLSTGDPQLDFSIAKVEFKTFDQPDWPSFDRYIGSMFLGKTWTPPLDPKIAMSRSFDGIKNKKTIGGFDYSIQDNIGAIDWAGHNPFELWKYPDNPFTVPPKINPSDGEQPMIVEDENLNLGRLGRRSWTISFDHFSESDLFGILEQVNEFPYNLEDNYPGQDSTFKELDIYNPFLHEENFFSRVWAPTLGGTIPMIFQQDKDNNNPDQFAIVTIKQKSLTVKPKAPNLYSFSFILEEVW